MAMNENIIFVFPGLGAQHVGMGRDVFRDFAVARYAFEEVSDAVGRDVAQICFYGNDADMRDTSLASLVMLANSAAITNVVSKEFGRPVHKIAYATAGHSMGEHTALYAAGALDLATAAQSLDLRGWAMEKVTPDNCGMVCIVGLSRQILDGCIDVARAFGYLSIANMNEENQFTVSGENAALDTLIDIARAHGARMARRMNVRIPAHSALLRGAQDIMRGYTDRMPVCAPKIKCFSNETADLISNPNDIKSAIIQQISNGVRWSEIMAKFPVYKITRAYEIGPGRALTGMIKRANMGCASISVSDVDGIRKMLGQLDSLAGRGR